MALKTLLLRKSIDDKKKVLEQLRAKTETFITREKELEAAIAEASTDEERNEVSELVSTYEAEKTEHETQLGDLEKEVEALETELAEAEKETEDPAPADPKPIPENERKDNKMTIAELRSSAEYVRAFAKYIKTENPAEVRALLTENAAEDGSIPVPTIVEGFVKTAWERDGIMSLVRKTYLKGNVKIGFELSADGAVIHEEGADAPAEEDLTLGVTTLIPQSVKKWITISDEAMDMDDGSFLQYVYDELTYQIAKKTADSLLAKIGALTASGSATSVPAGKLVASTIAIDTVVKALAKLSDEAANPVIVMNKLTEADFLAVQLASNYAFDIFRGIKVVYNNSMPTFANATSAAPYAIVGDFGVGAQANMPNGDEIRIKVDELSLAEQDLVKIVGRQYVAAYPVAPYAFTNIFKA